MTANTARILIRGAERLTAEGRRVAGDVLIDDGLIRRLDDVGVVSDAIEIDASGGLVVPGFIDLHVHGAGGDVFENASTEGNTRISAALARHGTVGVMATVATLPPDRMQAAVAAIAAVHDTEPGARILGVHLEGPFLNPQRCGAQNPAWMRPPSLAEVERLQAAAGGLIRMVTVAPELPGAVGFVSALRQRGITVAIGHTDATAEQVEAAIAAGATHVTHLFNAMAPLHHRAPGPAGVALTDDRLTVEVVADGHHLDRRIVDVVFRCKRPEQIALVSDAVAAGLTDGVHEMFGVRCEVRNGTIRTASGQLAGSCLTLDVALANLRAWLSDRHAVAELIRCVTTVPARVASVPAGSVTVGAAADVVVLDRAMRVAATVVKGAIAWRSEQMLAAQG